ncbi:hypothetical protein C8R46DRAFT_1000005 [Mycena filopes]|nr:hypothetical protein C8R46DRAFT_1000005 [Mycena filopes]
MPHFDGLSCWIEIEGSGVAAEYKVDIDHRVVTCYIPSEVGKTFCVAWQNSSLRMDTAGHVFMDGKECGGRVLRGPSATCARHAGVTDTRTLREFTFSSLTVTDDDAYLAQDEFSHRLGSIELSIYPIQIFAEVKEISNSSTLSEIKIHERSKKVLTQQIRLGEPKLLPASESAIAHCFTGPPIVTFVFRYRPKDILIAERIAPPPPQLKSMQSPPRVSSPEDSSEIEEMQVLRAKLDALEARHAERKRTHGHIHIKEDPEEENIPPSGAEPSRKKARLVYGV